jgi:Spy/CpxP family protein refolding chaperone
MKKTLLLSLAGVLGVSMLVLAEEPTTKPAKVRQAKVSQPWSKVTDLTDEQKKQLSDIHAEITDKINALKREEEERSNAVLTADQRAALTMTLDKERAERKIKDAEKKAAEKALKDGAKSDDAKPE